MKSATAALAGFRRSNDPLGSFALLTVGMLEVAQGDDDNARSHLRDADDLGSQIGSNWLQSSARTWLAVLAVRSGRLDEAATLLADSVRAIRETQPTTLTVTFALAAHGQLMQATGELNRAAMALGAADGVRARAGLRVWPIARRTERELVAAVADQVDAEAYRVAFAAGAELRMRDALTLISDDL